MKHIFLHGLGDRKEYSKLLPYFSIPKIDWNKSVIKPPIKKPQTIFAHSLGCMLAIMHAEKHKVKTLVLCSPTPGEETLSKVKADTIIFIVGENEHWVRTDISRLSQTFTGNIISVVIPNTKHTITNRYLKTILQFRNI